VKEQKQTKICPSCGEDKPYCICDEDDSYDFYFKDEFDDWEFDEDWDQEYD